MVTKNEPNIYETGVLDSNAEGNFVYTTPVSYTHLDVYKRQILCDEHYYFLILSGMVGLMIGHIEFYLFNYIMDE